MGREGFGNILCSNCLLSVVSSYVYSFVLSRGPSLFFELSKSLCIFSLCWLSIISVEPHAIKKPELYVGFSLAVCLCDFFSSFSYFVLSCTNHLDLLQLNYGFLCSICSSAT